MPALTTSGTPSHCNPIDLMEQIICNHDWAFERRNSSEMAAEAPGKWCDYGLYFTWSPELSAMHFTCALDFRVPEQQRRAVSEFLALANERLWLGHFCVDSDCGMPMFRQAVLLRGAPGPAPESMEDMIEIALSECERFYPAFHFIVQEGKTPQEAVDAAMLDCAGEA